MVVDASVWVAAFVKTDAHHDASAAFLIRTTEAGVPLHVPALVLPEVAGAIARRTRNAGRAEATLRSMLRLPNLSIHALTAESGMAAAGLAASFFLRGADAAYVALARQLDQPLISLDAEMIERTAGAVRVLMPE